LQLNGKAFDVRTRGLVKMTVSQRLRIMLGGSALLVVTGTAVACAFLPGFFAKSVSLGILVAAVVVMAPLFLVAAGVASLSTGPVTAVLLIAVAVATVLAFPIYPILRLRRFGWVSVAGVLAWIMCQLYVVVAARFL
jgi:hypothetical protein